VKSVCNENIEVHRKDFAVDLEVGVYRQLKHPQKHQRTSKLELELLDDVEQFSRLGNNTLRSAL
jgi:hypothetical protein